MTRGWPTRPRGLPSLAEARAYVAGVVYVALAVATLAVVVGTLWAQVTDGLINAPATGRWGFRTATLETTVVVAGVSPEASAAGLRQYDAIVAIDGRRVPPGATEFAIAERLARVTAPTLALTVRGDAGPAHAVRLRALPGVWLRLDPLSGAPLWVFAALMILAQPGWLLFAASLLLFLRRPRDPEAMLLATAFLLVNYTPDLLWWVDGFGLPRNTLSGLGTVGWLLTFVGMAGFPDGRFANRAARATVIAALALEAATLALRLRYHGVNPAAVQTAISWATGLTALCAGVAVLLRFRALPVGAERQQIKWAVGGFAITAAAASVVTFVDPATALMSGNPWLFVIFQVSALAMMAGFALGLLISLLGYRLYDAEAALAKSLAYGALSIALVGVFAASEKIVELVAGFALGQTQGAVSGVIGAALAAILIGPLHHRVMHWAEHRFQRRLIRLREGLPATMEDLRETEGLPAIGAAAAAATATAIRAERAAVLAGEAVIGAFETAPDAVAAWRDAWRAPVTGGLSCDPGDRVFPVRVALLADGEVKGEGARAPTGWLLLGARPDGSLPGRAERAALADIAPSIARAIETVRRRDAREQAHERRIDTLEARLASALAALERPAAGDAAPAAG